MSAGASILSILEQAASAFGIPASLFLAQAQQESGLNPNAYNPKSGATGLLQLEPSTAASYGVTGSALTDPTQNANAGAAYLSDLFSQFGDWTTALAAYDWGPTNVERAMQAYGPNWLSYAPAETQNYVASILGSSGATSPATVASSPSAVAAPFQTTILPAEDSGSFDVAAAAPAGGAAPPNILLLLLIGLGVYFGATWLAEGL